VTRWCASISSSSGRSGPVIGPSGAGAGVGTVQVIRPIVSCAGRDECREDQVEAPVSLLAEVV